MSDSYLLAASLLATAPISVPPPPTLPPNLFDRISAILGLKTAEALPSVTSAPSQILPLVEITSPEFSQLQSIPISDREALLPENPTSATVINNGKISSNPQLTSLAPTSGTQLYYQRLAALKAGKIYTRLAPDSFKSAWAKESQNLTKPTHQQWQRLLQQEAKSMAKGQGNNRLAILLGDSLTMWFPSASLPSGKFWLNQGISGENTTQIKSRIDAFSETRPDTIYVMAGTNDLRQGVSDRVILNNIRQIIRTLHENHPEAQIILQSILPMRLSSIYRDRIANLNLQLALIARQEGAGYLNLHNLFIDDQGQIQPDLTTDGIHLTSRGYQVWQEALNSAESALGNGE
ncbi:MAG TPA: acylhydrolase [Cyanobacteria bacterium UBA11367]|nr:acylhydrolase [Cyanobacteria bacterium UBA11367]HCA96334.1 acylhydrolase [Cyanobacteria bacterium UBA9226]